MEKAPMSGWAKLDMLLHAARVWLKRSARDDSPLPPLPEGASWAWDTPEKIDLARLKVRFWDAAKRSS